VVEDKLIKLPDTISYRDGAMIEPMRLGLGLANKAKKGDVAVILGQELIGLTALARLKERGVEQVITADVSKKRVRISQDIGADIAVHTLNEDIFEVVMNATKDKGADIIIDVSCRPESLQQAVALTRPFGDIWLGTFYTAGAFFNPSWQGPGMVSMNLTQKPGLSIHCAWGTLGPWMPNLQKAVEMMQSGTITADKCVTHVFPLEQIKEAFEIAMDPHESIKVMIEP
jgi:threonine dehydrogenase-like Zn-dependent dehydrogenase